ncbi:MAG: TVP38/TMEM64 family protein [Candidatus Eremiobacteraeota bacterium]|nr:TVP38/TMEM64 family protein [Candidatus Eremiobacteraeota bacterium]
MEKHWQKILGGFFWAAALIGYLIYTRQNDLTALESLKRIATFVRESSYGPLIFIVLYTVRPIFLFSAALLTIGAGALFGPVWGMIYSVVGANLGATLAFYLGRFFGEGLLDVDAQDTRLAPYIKRMRERSFETVFLMRLLFLPYDLVNYLAGILRVNYWAFLTATVLGSIPGTISFVLFGASSGLNSGTPKFDWRILAASVAIFVLSIAVSKLLRRNEEPL